MTNFNKLGSQIALAQGLEIGSPEWTAGGLHAYSGQTGGHPAYGWRRMEPMTMDRVRAVISNYAARGCWYLNEPLRESGYLIGGRPVGWKPEDYLDGAHGERVYATENFDVVYVSGPDVQHFWIDPLFDIIDRASESWSVYTGTNGSKTPLVPLARTMCSMLIDTLAGMIRHHGQWWGGGRTFARVCDTFAQGAKRGLVSDESAQVFLEWLDKFGLPALEWAPGVVEAKGIGRWNLYQDLSWVLPAVYDLIPLVKDLPLRSRLILVQNRLAQWVLDIWTIKGGVGAWADCAITDEMLKGPNPVESLIGAVTREDISGPEWYGAWAIRSIDIAGFIHPSPMAADYLLLALNAVEKPNDPSVACWLVDRNRIPLL